ncbi:MAG: UDP-N-acetylmuramate--L-alanine ligase, partial [Candidatus Margulisiibacteriota bacterium]
MTSSSLLASKRRIHFIGIGGSGMNPLARVLIDMGYEVSGSDIKENLYTLKLKEMGAQIFYGHNESNIRVADLIVISTAITSDNVEYRTAVSNGIPILKRAELLSFIMDEHTHRIAVCGTHGKTTVSCFLSHFLVKEEKDPSFIIGATLRQNQLSSNYGRKEYCVAEADESDRSFLFLNPTIMIITNIEEEHLDEYSGLDDILSTFNEFIGRLHPPDSLLIVCGDDPNIAKLKISGITVISYGFGSSNLVQARNLILKNNRIYYDVYIQNELVAEHIHLNIPGTHNVLNSLTVFALSHFLRFPFSHVLSSFHDFQGASRRFHLVGKVNNIEVYDDYAHHPTEIACTLEAAKTFGRRVIAVFQPHRFTRFSAFFNRFYK